VNPNPKLKKQMTCHQRNCFEWCFFSSHYYEASMIGMTMETIVMMMLMVIVMMMAMMVMRITLMSSKQKQTKQMK